MHIIDFSFLSITHKYLLLVADIDKTTDNFTFLFFKKKFITCRLCTPEGKKAQM